MVKRVATSANLLFLLVPSRPAKPWTPVRFRPPPPITNRRFTFAVSEKSLPEKLELLFGSDGTLDASSQTGALQAIVPQYKLPTRGSSDPARRRQPDPPVGRWRDSHAYGLESDGGRTAWSGIK